MISAGMTKEEVFTEIIFQVKEGINKLNDALRDYDGEDIAEKARLEGIVDGYQQALDMLCAFTSQI